MNRRAAILILLFAGWLLGYMHHYLATRTEMNDLMVQNMAMHEEITKLRASIPAAMKVNVKATAYSNDPYSIDVAKWRDGLTATNTQARRGIAAADWRVFPPGTRLYIPGYGEATVEDRGGAVKGYHVDLFVDSYNEAIRWGNKDMEIYVLEMGKG
ncbi:MAG: 3D domain-containing protein [Nitrospirota bacterium]|jgi:3D (Asp-Asp-Asp) domain-containing protein